MRTNISSLALNCTNTTTNGHSSLMTRQTRAKMPSTMGSYCSSATESYPSHSRLHVYITLSYSHQSWKLDAKAFVSPAQDVQVVFAPFVWEIRQTLISILIVISTTHDGTWYQDNKSFSLGLLTIVSITCWYHLVILLLTLQSISHGDIFKKNNMTPNKTLQNHSIASS